MYCYDFPTLALHLPHGPLPTLLYCLLFSFPAYDSPAPCYSDNKLALAFGAGQVSTKDKGN